MARTIQHILLDLEVAPPAEAWQQVAARLDLEYDQAEVKTAQKLSDLEVAPPAAAWQYIANALEVTAEESVTPVTPAKKIRIPFRKLAAAAAVTGIALLAGWFLLGTGKNNTQAPTSLNREVPPTDNITIIQTPPPATDSSNNLPTPIVERPSIARTTTATHSELSNANTLADVPTHDIDYATPHTTIQSESATATAAVPAPPIRDKSGNIVMDLRLLVGAGAGNNYITVTGPNGEQTRISRKFLPMLTHLSSSLEIGQPNDQWKNRFREWRDKLLRQASFAPSATNFLDIMELKEMIEEK